VVFFLQVFPTKTLWAPLLVPTHITWPAQLTVLISAIVTIFAEEYKTWSFSTRNFLHSPLTSSQNTFLCNLFLITLRLHSSLGVRHQRHKRSGCEADRSLHLDWVELYLYTPKKPSKCVKRHFLFQQQGAQCNRYAFLRIKFSIADTTVRNSFSADWLSSILYTNISHLTQNRDHAHQKDQLSMMFWCSARQLKLSLLYETYRADF
jgi:hypothetical protein